jgi:hypothetical protein
MEFLEDNLQFFQPHRPLIEGILRVIMSPAELKMQPTIH